MVDPRDVVIVGNTGDDDWFHGLRVCPDLDSVTYALAGANNPETGWGLAGETFATLGALERYGVPTWFNIGDRDFATHLYRTERLRAGEPLSAVTADIAAAWGLDVPAAPDDRRRGRDPHHRGDAGRKRGARARGVVRAGALRASGGLGALRRRRVGAARRPACSTSSARPDAIVICPANPIVSIAPILAVPGIREAVAAHPRVVGISNLIAGAAVRGPADRMLADLGIEASCVGVARGYRDLCDAFVIDEQDAARARARSKHSACARSSPTR